MMNTKIRIALLGMLILLLMSFQQDRKKDIPVILKDWLENPEKSPLIDFSFAGYHQAEELPSIRNFPGKTFLVTDFGAVANDGKDDIAAIQRAVDAAEASGGGIVKFPPGVFDFDVESYQQFVWVKSSGILILGAGEGQDGTTLLDHHPSDYPDKTKPWMAGIYPSFFYVGAMKSDVEDSPLEGDSYGLIKLSPARRNSLEVTVDQPAHIKAGEVYVLSQSDVDSSLLYDLIKPLKKAGKGPTGNPNRFKTLIRVKRMEKNILTLDAPLLWNLEARWNPVLTPVHHKLENVGIAGFHLKTGWNKAFYHHFSPEHDDGWNHILMRFAVDSWVQSILHENATTAVALGSCLNCSVFDCQITGNPGHNGFVVGGLSTRNLLYNLKGGKQMHTWSISGHACGNVFYNCLGEEPSAIDCHAGINVYNLFDNIYFGAFRHGGAPSNLPPAHGNYLVLWNWKLGFTEPYKGRLLKKAADLKDTPGLIAVGLKGIYGQVVFIEDEKDQEREEDFQSEWGWVENLNQEVYPYSLYNYQKELRLKSSSKD